MITASIKTQQRTISVPCADDKDKAISALQDSVSNLTEEDGRCQFIVLSNGTEIYSWYYQPTFREEKKSKSIKKDSQYEVSSEIYVIREGEELSYDSFYDEGVSFNSVAEARRYMKDKNYSQSEYRIAYEYIISDINGSCIYGTGLGYSREEAKVSLNQSIAYYGLKLNKQNKVVSL